MPDKNAMMQSTNLYVYSMNDPVNYHDPNGNNAIAIGGGAGFAIGGPPGAVVGVVTADVIYAASEHTKNARPSTLGHGNLVL